MSVLYISYDGMLEPLGQSQVLGYLKYLAKSKTIYLISFEKPNDWKNISERNSLKEEIKSNGIVWVPLTYHKRPSFLATSWDILIGFLVGLSIVLRYRIKIVHARSYVAAMIALGLKKITRVKFIFDMRGFWADERVDGNIWKKNSVIYSLAKWFEKKYILNADHIISLTNAGIQEIKKFKYVQNKKIIYTVIPTCADLEKFKVLQKTNSNFCVGYVGTIGTWYMWEELILCLKIIFENCPDATFLVINRNEHDSIRNSLIQNKIDLSRVEIISASHNEMPKYINRMSFSVFFIKPVFSKLASAPTKLGELLGCGVPCLSNEGVGDYGSILKDNKVGVAVNSFQESELKSAILEIIQLSKESGIAMKCRNVASQYFSIEKGVEKYLHVYETIC